MSSIAKTVVATGASSGLGFEAIKLLLAQSQPYKFILGCRDTQRVQSTYDGLTYDKEKHSIDLLPLELADLRTVKKFASQTIQKLDNDKLDVLFLNAALVKPANEPGANGSRWSEQYVVNHLSQHYLIHLLREKLISSRSRIVVVSSGAIRGVKDTNTLDDLVKAQSGAEHHPLYAATKFIQLLGAQWWKRQLQDQCDIIAVSPGFIPGTGLGRNISVGEIPENLLKDAKSNEEGAKSMLEAFTKNDFPEDKEQIFLTSWGEWWSKDVYALALDKKLQDRWSPSQKEIEEQELVD